MPKIFGAKNLSADDMPSGIDAAKIGAGSVSNTEFGYLDGVTSAIQTQITAKQAALSSSNKLGLDSGGTNANLSATGGATHVLRQASAGAAITVGALAAADIPATLNATTFGGDVILAKGVNTDYSSLLRAAANDYLISLCGGSAIGGVYGAYIQMWGNSHYSTPGDAKYYCGTASGAEHSFFDKNGVERQRIQEDGVSCLSPVVSVGTSFTTLRAVAGNQALMIATVTGTGSILLEWDGSTLTKLAGVSTLVVAGSAGAGETAFRVSGGNLQAIVDTGTRNVSSGFSVRH